MEAENRLAEIAQQLREKKTVEPVSVRQFLSWFGSQRRGSWTVQWIRGHLQKANLQTEPDFDSVFIDAPISFSLVQPAAETTANKIEAPPIEIGVSLSASIDVAVDPTYRISKLAAASNKPVSVTPDDNLEKATTLMLTHDFSQLPVMTSDREVKGIITWNSIGTRLALGKKGSFVREFMDNHQEISSTASLFKAIPIIVQYQYVLIRGDQNRITGIVTASDLSRQFQELAEPFLLLGEIENHIRLIIGDKFSSAELSDMRDSEDGDREVNSINDLTFGEYVRLLQSADRWKRINLPIDRVVFCDQLDTVRKIRNEVMHFNPDPMKEEDLQLLRNFAEMLRRLQSIGIP